MVVQLIRRNGLFANTLALSLDDARYRDLGSDYVRHRTDPRRRTQAHVRQLEALGYTVTLTPVA